MASSRSRLLYRDPFTSSDVKVNAGSFPVVSRVSDQLVGRYRADGRGL